MILAVAPDALPLLRTVAALRTHVAAARAAGGRVALVPTMGALHDGHMALVTEGLRRGCKVIASVFVNPTQFGPNEDFAAYPRTLEADCEKLARAGADAVYHPGVAEMYPEAMQTTVSVRGVTGHLEGPARPGHFDGVATVVAKLLLQCLPDIALFGEKDWQQLQVVKRMARDLDVPVDIVGVPTVRDAHGLALSSRNAYLNDAELAVARRLNVILFDMASAIRAGAAWPDALAKGRAALDGAGFNAVDYLEVRDAASLAVPAMDQTDTLRILAAVRLGRARLIDNVGVEP